MFHARFLRVLLLLLELPSLSSSSSIDRSRRLRLQSISASVPRPITQQHRAAAMLVHDQDQQHNNSSLASYDPDKQQPEKLNCSRSSRQKYGLTTWWDFRRNESVPVLKGNHSDQPSLLCPEEEEDANVIGSNLSNRILMSLLVAAPMDHPSMGVPLTCEVIRFVNQSSGPELMFQLGSLPNHAEEHDDDWAVEQGNLGNYGEPVLNPQPTQYQVVATHMDSSLVVRNESVWWWQYDIVFACYQAISVTPLLNQSILSDISKNTSLILYQGIDSGTLLVYTRKFESTSQVMGFAANLTATEDALLVPPNQPWPSAPPSADNGSDTDRDDIEDSFDPRAWDTVRYIGLGVFVGTLLFTSLCMAIASYRQHKLKEQSVWGNLKLDEAGVNELLNTGWKIQDQRTVQVFEKDRSGYNDDDSLLIGGFEQRNVTSMAGEIVTVTQSETTPHTNSEPKDRVRA